MSTGSVEDGRSSTSGSGTTVCILHDQSNTGLAWRGFVENMFGENLPEEHKSLNLDISSEVLNNISSDAAEFANNTTWRIVLLTTEVVDMLRDEQSSLNRNNIMQTDNGEIIILLIGNQDDMNYQRRASESLHRFSSFPSFHLVRVKDTEQIFFDIVELLSPVTIEVHPTTISYEDTHQYLMFLSNKPYKRAANVSYSVIFSDGESNDKVMNGVLINPYTLLVENPRHTPGILNVKLYVDDGEKDEVQLGSKMQIWQLSDLDRLYTILDKQNDPIQFLSQAMKLKSVEGDSLQIIDRYLVDSFKKNVPSNKLEVVFGNDQGFDGNQDLKSDQCVPTLLHFSAMYGLCELTSFLLQCPGALRAFGTANCEDDFPTNLAEKYGHWDLKEYMTRYMQVSALVDAEYGSLNQTTSIMSNLVSGQYLSFNQMGDEFFPQKPGAVEEPQPEYLTMHPLSSPMIVPIMEDEDECYSKMIQKVLEGNEEDLYETLTHPNAKGVPYQHSYKPLTYTRGLDAAPDNRPPLPPPREPGASRNSISESPKQPMAYKDITIPVVPALMSPAQQELINLQQKVKNKELTINQALLRFREWGKNHKERAASFQYQQERLEKIRQSIIRRNVEKKTRGNGSNFDLEISQPVASGSSTYDRVLVKTIKDKGPDFVQDAYGSVTESNQSHAVENNYRSTPTRDAAVDYGQSRINRFTSQRDIRGRDNLTRKLNRNQNSVDNPPPLPARDDFNRPNIPPRNPKR